MMDDFNWKNQIESFDKRRDIIIAGNAEETALFCAKQFIQIGKEAIEKSGVFTVAFSGGHTPHAIFKEISKPEYAQTLDWKKILCFWSDERSVPPGDAESNYFNAMQAGLAHLPLLPENIFRMPAEKNIEENALAYEHAIREKIPSLQFDLIMLGMGEDGHTASLFPRTHGLHTQDRLVIANYVPQKQTWRMSFTYECIQMAKNICIYVIGANKANTVKKVLLEAYDPDNLPIQKVGTLNRKALWILDDAASQLLDKNTKTQRH